MKKWIRALVAGVVILAVILFGIFVLSKYTERHKAETESRRTEYKCIGKQYIE